MKCGCKISHYVEIADGANLHTSGTFYNLGDVLNAHLICIFSFAALYLQRILLHMAEQTDLRLSPRYAVGTLDGTGWKTDYPLTVDGCLIMLCERGSADITINSRRFRMKSGGMAFIVFDMVAVPVYVSADFKAKFISLDFNTAQDIFFLITSNRFWDYIYTFPLSKLDKVLTEVVERWFAIGVWTAENCSEVTAETVLRNEMENLMLVMAERIESHHGVLGTNPPKNRAWLIINEFLGLLNRYYTRRHDVAFYAEKLNISPNYLNIISKRNIGVTAKDQITNQLVLVIKMLLDSTDLTVKEIAERLHYDDPSYLCRIFRKQTGLSPIQYRNKHNTK